MANWADLKCAIRTTGRFDCGLILRIALARARRERDAFAAMGLPQAWPGLFAHELGLTWQVAKAAMDGLIAERLDAALTPLERAARSLELRAEIALTAIPPRDAEAAELRARAAAIRADAAPTPASTRGDDVRNAA